MGHKFNIMCTKDVIGISHSHVCNYFSCHDSLLKLQLEPNFTFDLAAWSVASGKTLNRADRNVGCSQQSPYSPLILNNGIVDLT